MQGHGGATALQPHRDSLGAHVLFHLADGELAEVEDAGGQDGVGLALDDALAAVMCTSSSTP